MERQPWIEIEDHDNYGIFLTSVDIITMGIHLIVTSTLLYLDQCILYVKLSKSLSLLINIDVILNL